MRPEASSSGSNGNGDDFVYVQIDRNSGFPGLGEVENARRGRKSLLRFVRSLSRFQRRLLLVVLVLFLGSLAIIFRRLSATLGEPSEDVRGSLARQGSRHPGRLTGGSMQTGSSFDRKQAGFDRVVVDQQNVLPIPDIQRFDGPENDRQRAVMSAFQHAWSGYRKKAWGHDHLKSVSGGHHDWFGVGLTILDSLDTMYIMGLTEEFEVAKKWVENDLSFDVPRYVNLFETTIRCLGGLLSTYFLSGEPVFLKKAQDLGERLLGAFSTPSGIPYSDVNLGTRKGKPPNWSVESSLSEVTTLQLEFRALSRATGNSLYERLAFNVSRKVHDSHACRGGLCPMFLNPKTGRFRNSTITFGARADSYYEYLIKQWLQTGKTIDWLRQDYVDAMESMHRSLYRYSEPGKFAFVGELIGGSTFSPKMDHLACFIAGCLGLGTLHGLPAIHLDWGRELGFTCRQFYETPTGLAPEIAHFNMLPKASEADLYIKPLDAHSLLRPEAVEAWFYLFRVTGDRIYQDWGWRMFEAIEKYARTPYGYASVSNVKKVPPHKRDMMESFLMGETFKYLYLLMGNRTDVLPLKDWVFNTEAHPLPVYGS